MITHSTDAEFWDGFSIFEPIPIEVSTEIEDFPPKKLSLPSSNEVAMPNVKKRKVLTFRRKLYMIVEAGWQPWDFIFNFTIFALIMISIVLLVISTIEEMPQEALIAFHVVDGIIVTVFLIEYCLRVYVSIERKSLKQYGPIIGRFFYCIRVMSILDLLSIGSYIGFYVIYNLGLTRVIWPQLSSIFRLARFLLLFKAEKHLQSFKTLLRVFQSKKDVLTAAAFIAAILWIVSACLLFLAERDNRPDLFPDIPATLWTTLLLVGAYDIPLHNLTVWGQIIVGIGVYVSFWLFTFPAIIIIYGYDEASKSVRLEYLRTVAGSESDSDYEDEREPDFAFKSLKDVTAPNWCPNCKHCLKKLEIIENLEKIKMRRLLKEKKEKLKKKAEGKKVGLKELTINTTKAGNIELKNLSGPFLKEQDKFEPKTPEPVDILPEAVILI